MTSKKNNNDNKSLFLYTSLIFIVAILLIIIAFFGQTNMQKSQPPVIAEETSQPSNNGITERASVLSEENRVLLEEKTRLENELKEKEEIIAGLKKENTLLNEQIETNNLLMQANGYLSAGNMEMAAEKLNLVKYDSLTSDQQIIYNKVKNKLDK